MQWNCTTPFIQNPGYDPFSVSKPPSYPQIIGEGDVTSAILPDGTIKLYFVPTKRYVTWSPFLFNSTSPNLHCTSNSDIWFVRSISHPLPPGLLNRPFPNVYGDQQLPPQFNSNFCFNLPPCPDYYQKFHNDDSTSTTDIHYFYPSPRCKGSLNYSAAVQTEPFAFNNTNGTYRNQPCVCQCGGEVKKKKSSDRSASSTSYMSIDSTSKSKHKLTKKSKKKSKSKTKGSRDHRCECNLETKCASDKSVTTYAEKASGGVIKGGRHTQTASKKSKRSDIKTELWIPIDSKSRSLLRKDTCHSCYSGTCSCRMSESDSY